MVATCSFIAVHSGKSMFGILSGCRPAHVGKDGAGRVSGRNRTLARQAAQRQELTVGVGIDPSAASRARPSVNSTRSPPAGASNSRDTGSPRLVRPTGSTRAGSPAVLAGPMLRAIAVLNGTLLPRTCTLLSSPISGAGTRVVGNTI